MQEIWRCQNLWDLIRISLNENMQVARDLGVMATPAFVLIKDGIIEKVKLGGLTHDKIMEMLA
jgi:protein-disulfide isomerase